jgi:hypothetical protein
MFTANLPFVSWFQDHMEQLMTKEAGVQIGSHDFVLTDAGPLYAHNYDYPARQIIAMPKLTAAPALLPRPTSAARDLIYVSNNTRSPQALLDLLLRETKDSAAERHLVVECHRRLISMHAAGDTLANYLDVCDFLRELALEMKIELAPKRFEELARVVNHPVVDALYRHQALQWIAKAADEMGLKFSLYGKGWEAHPELGRFARGPVAAGVEQQKLTRAVAINFQIAPYLCLHQRLLDGICAGGFFLVRKHVADSAPQELLDLLETHCGSHINRLHDARAFVPPPVRDRFERLVKTCEQCLRFTGEEDCVELVRAFQESQLLVPSAGVLPHLDQVSFSDYSSLKQRIARFAADADLREKIILQQRDSIVSRFTYSAAMRRVARRIGELLPRESSNAFVVHPVNIDIGRAA